MMNLLKIKVILTTKSNLNSISTLIKHVKKFLYQSLKTLNQFLRKEYLPRMCRQDWNV